MQTARLQDEPAERVRLSHERAIVELQDLGRELLAVPACVGFAHLSMSADQTISGADTALNFNTVACNSVPDIIRPDESSQITLAPGYCYRMVACVYQSGTGESLQIQWRDVTNSAYVGVRGYAPSVDVGSADSIQPLAVYAVDNKTRYVDVRIQAQSISGTPTVGYQYSWLSVEAYRS